MTPAAQAMKPAAAAKPRRGFPVSMQTLSEMAVPGAVLGIVLALIAPMPSILLDLLIVCDIMMSVVVLMVAMYITRPVDFNVFPTTLLMLTLFRLALNVSSARLILLNGHTGTSAAGDVIQAFGNFVVGGNYIIGAVIFLVLIAIQYVVINHGAVRISEVTARFTLDALPGKQMSIDSDLNAGLIDEATARRRRKELSAEAEFFGAMDGASRFTQRDAVAGLLITGINIVAGLLIGVLQHGLDVMKALQTYTILTIGASAVQELAHETENLLDLARSGRLEMSSEIVELILRSADELNVCLDRAGSMPLNELPRCNEALLAAISSRAERVGLQETDPVAAQPPAPFPTLPPAAPVSPVDPAAAPETRMKSPVAEVKAPAVVVPATEASAPDSAGAGKSTAETSVVRIETAKLEYLIDMVGELVIAESVVRHDPAIAASQDPVLTRNLTQLARVVQEVQKTSMSMRMVAVASLFRKMSRLTRDLARKSGKQIELVTVGDDVELDRSIVEDLADPMVHMIRNAVDHGLEMPEDRRKAGKPLAGRIRLKAMHDAGDIVIEIADDGRGMDPARILAKARRLGLVSEQDTPDEESIFRLIFEAGFSTAEKVTDMSGRGVGMDVVKKKIQKLRGRVSIRSVLGQGCTFVLRLPLTLAIIDGLVVGVGSQRYILPMFAIREMFSPGPGTVVTLENRLEAALFRERLLPLIRLSKLIPERLIPEKLIPEKPMAEKPMREKLMPETDPDHPTPERAVSESEAPADSAAVSLREERRSDAVLIVVEGRDQLYCVAVDQLVGKQEVVIKSLGQVFRDVPAVSGGAILGDGRVGLIIDVNSLRYQK